MSAEPTGQGKRMNPKTIPTKIISLNVT